MSQKNFISKLIISLLLICGTAFGHQLNPTKLPPCPTDQRAWFHNCFGTWKGEKGEEYIGDFKDNQFYGFGHGTLFLSGEKYIGELIDGIPNGKGISYSDKGDYFGDFKNGFFYGWGTLTFANGDVFVGTFPRIFIGKITFSNGDKYFGELRSNGHSVEMKSWSNFWTKKPFERHGLGIETRSDGRRREGIWEKDTFIDEEKIGLLTLINSFAYTFSQYQIDRLRQLASEERGLSGEVQIKTTNENKSKPLNLAVSHTQPTPDGILTITIHTNADTASLKINGEEQGGRADGTYIIKKVARVGQDTQFTITAVDINGNSDSKTITVSRLAASAAGTSIALKPEAIKRAPTRDAVAIIIGIQNYKRVPRAEFANNDAREFNEYAIRALGIRPEKIKMLVDEEADEVNIVKAFENWLPIQVNKDKTDVYVFYSGHGLPAPDGKSLYFLPHGVDKELLSRTAVAQNEIVAALTAAKPKSVTMFIDACYSGQTRGGDVLIPNEKPVVPKLEANPFPANFTVITASANDQTSLSSPELKHGIFSFYLMKGMEGDADANQDGKITVGEMQDYLSDKVTRQATTLGRKQNTQVVGDSSRILVSR